MASTAASHSSSCCTLHVEQLYSCLTNTCAQDRQKRGSAFLSNQRLVLDLNVLAYWSICMHNSLLRVSPPLECRLGYSATVHWVPHAVHAVRFGRLPLSREIMTPRLHRQLRVHVKYVLICACLCTCITNSYACRWGTKSTEGAEATKVFAGLAGLCCKLPLNAMNKALL